MSAILKDINANGKVNLDLPELVADLSLLMLRRFFKRRALTVALDVPTSGRGRFAFWRVNGQPWPLKQRAVTVPATGTLHIQAVGR